MKKYSKPLIKVKGFCQNCSGIKEHTFNCPLMVIERVFKNEEIKEHLKGFYV